MTGSGRIGVLISGRGSNMEALASACDAGKIEARIVLVVSNVPSAAGLERAHARGIETKVLDHRAATSREAHDRKLAEALDGAKCDLVCLAGYMRLLTPWFVARFQGRAMNIHPSLLPAFPGLDAQAAAIACGAKVPGATVHFVDAELDHGPIVVQASVPVLETDTPESLSARILVEEHRIYPEAVRLFFEGRLRIEGQRVRISQSP